VARVKPKMPLPKPRPQCSVAGFLAGLAPGAFDHPIVLDSGLGTAPTQGLVTGKTITVNGPGTGIELTADLILIAEGDLTVNEDIIFPDQNDPNDLNISLILASTKGKVAVNATVGDGHAPPGERVKLKQGSSARAEAGKNGGYILITGINVDIAGGIQGNAGGHGGNATIDGPATPGDDVEVAGGGGGHGGDVVICAFDSIHLGGSVFGSEGARGGKAVATVDRRGNGYAIGGDAGDCGYVVIESTSADCEMFIDRGSVITGITPRPGVRGGEAVVERRPDPRPVPVALGDTDGGSAKTQGGAGGAGGVLLFQVAGLFVNNLGGLGAGDGGRGGDAYSYGGEGSPGTPGNLGGPAAATGGSGGAAGYVGDYTDLTTQLIIKGARKAAGHGGKAYALAGDGGRGRKKTKGGDSGEGHAIGGANGDGVAAPVVPPAASDPGTVPFGGDAKPVEADGR
jgi:hypothetical protein